MDTELVIYLISGGLMLGSTLVIYAHHNFATKNEVKEIKEDNSEALRQIEKTVEKCVTRDAFNQHREDINKRDVELKEWLVRIERKLDNLAGR